MPHSSPVSEDLIWLQYGWVGKIYSGVKMILSAGEF